MFEISLTKHSGHLKICDSELGRYLTFLSFDQEWFLNFYNFSNKVKVPHDPGSQDRAFLKLCIGPSTRWENIRQT